MYSTRVSIRKGLKSIPATLVYDDNNRTRLVTEDEGIVFDVTREEIVEIKIQQHFIYITIKNAGRFSLSVIREIEYQDSTNRQPGSLNSKIDSITGEWKKCFSGNESDNVKPVKVSRVSAKTLFIITLIMLTLTQLINWLNK